MPKSVPITKHFPNQWCHRTRIWYPEREFRGQAHASVQTEGGLHPDVGDFLLQLHMHGDHVDEAMVGQMRAMAAEIRKRAADARTVQDVMGS